MSPSSSCLESAFDRSGPKRLRRGSDSPNSFSACLPSPNLYSDSESVQPDIYNSDLESESLSFAPAGVDLVGPNDSGDTYNSCASECDSENSVLDSDVIMSTDSPPSGTIVVGAKSFSAQGQLYTDALPWTRLHCFEKAWPADQRGYARVYIKGYHAYRAIALDWLARGGFPHYGFLADLISVFVNEPGTLFKADSANGPPVDRSLDVTEGDYLFCPNGPGAVPYI